MSERVGWLRFGVSCLYCLVGAPVRALSGYTTGNSSLAAPRKWGGAELPKGWAMLQFCQLGTCGSPGLRGTDLPPRCGLGPAHEHGSTG